MQSLTADGPHLAGRIVVTPLRYDRTDEDAYAALAEKLPRLP